LEYQIKEYPLQQGALEIQYIEEYFTEFPRKKSATEILDRLQDRTSLILMAEAPLPEDPGMVVPVSFKVLHELRENESDPKMFDLVERIRDVVDFTSKKVLYNWLGATRRDWRGQGFFRALSEQQEEWALDEGFDEIVVKTKNRYYDMRGTLDHLRYDVIKFEPNPEDNQESKVYMRKRLGERVRDDHRSARRLSRS
jgi:GNAT superfamily N-acetyltransferase